MILPIVNVIAGFVLAAPKLKEWFAKQHIEGVEGALNRFRAHIGFIVLLVGLVGLLKRMDVVIRYDWSWHYGSSFPQAIIAIVMGLLLCANFFSKWPAVHSKIMKLNKYSGWIGILGILLSLSV